MPRDYDERHNAAEHDDDQPSGAVDAEEEEADKGLYDETEDVAPASLGDRMEMSAASVSSNFASVSIEAIATRSSLSPRRQTPTSIGMMLASD